MFYCCRALRKSRWKLSNLMKMIYKAKIAGADAVKIQAYEANGITMDSNKDILN